MVEKNILIADDDQSVLDFLREMLQAEGYRVFLAQNGQEAVATVKNNPIDMAILDLKMPIMDGIEALKNIKEFDRKIEVLIMTAYADLESMRQTIIEHGAFDYLIKPFYKSEILHIMRNALMKRELISQNIFLKKDLQEHILKLEKDFEERTHQLRESQIKYKEIVENSNDAIVVTQDEKLKFVNPKTIELTGYRQEEILDIHFMELVHPDDRSMVMERHMKRLQGEDLPTTYSFRALKKNKESFWVEISAIKTIWEGRPATLSFIRDISDRKQAEETLQESETRFRSLIEQSPFAIQVFDEKGLQIEANNAFEKIWNVKKENQIGTFNILKDEGAKKEGWLSYVKRAYSGEVVIMPELELDPSKIGYPEGHPRWIRTYLYPIRHREGNVKNLVIMHENITEKKGLEDQVQQLQKMEAIGTLAGGIAHDFNNLLMAIQGYASLMLLGFDSGHPYYEHLNKIEENVRMGADLTKQLLGFARKGKYEVKSADLNEMVMETSSMFGRTRKEITIHQKYEKNLWTVEVDQSQIEQVLLNIYINAWQAMPDGGNLSLETKNVRLADGYCKSHNVEPGNYAKISITDTGVGMDEATRERIFEPFFTTKEMGRGTGLGLASVYGIIKNHSGIIDVYSEKGEGTTFHIYLPSSGKKAIREKRMPETILKGTETILLVDDEDMIIDIGEQLLKEIGYKVLIARSGKEAIETYKENQNKIDMVLLDMIMPGVGGGETYDILKSINPDINVLLSSGYSINGQATEILERGCDGFIQKPFNLKELSKKVREILDKKES